MSDRTSYFIAVYVVFLKDDMVLLHRRKNTGWLDGWYDAPAGHLEPGESFLEAAVREAAEETGVKITPNNLELFHIGQAETNRLYTYLMFRVKNWEGEPKLVEPDKAEDLNFYPLDKLPSKIPPYTRSGIENVKSTGISFSYLGPDPSLYV
jgi:8-oxo-dGTP diphosphatase